MPHPTTVSRAVKARAKSERELVKQQLNQVIQDGYRISFTADMWTEQYKQISYLTITAHWIDDNWELRSQVLCTDEFDATLKKTGDNIKAAIKVELQSLGLNTDSSNLTFTTDRGANMIAALRNDNRLDCSAHILNTVLRNTFDPKKDCPEEITELLTASKGLVRYFKKTGYQTLLKRALQQSCDSRWNSIYAMLQSVHQEFDDIENILKDHAQSELHRHSSIDKDLLAELLPFLQVIHSLLACLFNNDASSSQCRLK